MRLYKVAFKLKLKELIKNKAYIGVLLILPILSFILMTLGRGYEDEGTLKAGIWSEKDSILGEQIKLSLLQDKEIAFKAYDEIKALEQAVATGKIECGFIIDPEIDDKREKGELRKTITVVKSPATMAEGTLQEIVTATIYRYIVKDITYEVLHNKPYMKEGKELENWLEAQIDSYYAEGDLMEINFVTNSKRHSQQGSQNLEGMLKLTKGILVIFLLVSSLLVGIKVIEEKKSETYKRLCTTSKRWCYLELPLIGANMTLQLGVAVGSLFLIKVVGGGIGFDLIEEFVMVVIYLVSLNVVTLLVSLWIRKSQLWLSMIPILIIANVIFCPIIIDMSSIQTPLKYISYVFLSYYYLKGQDYLGVLIGISIIGILIYLISGKLKLASQSDDIVCK